MCDNLNTHRGGALYSAFPAPEAKRLCDRLEFHPTPKHGRWLNGAETERSVLSTPCLDRRMESKELVTVEVPAWESNRNRREVKIRWRFTTDDARIKSNGRSCIRYSMWGHRKQKTINLPKNDGQPLYTFE